MNNNNKNFTVYKASAGAGKTFTLVKEYLKLCVSNEQVDYYKTILAITFTNKAAMEMRHRVLEILKAWTNGLDDNKSAFIMLGLIANDLKLDKEIVLNRAIKIFKHMLHNYSDISIKTIDKFTTQVVRTFANDLGLNSNFNVVLNNDEVIAESVTELLTEAGSDSLISDLLIKFSASQIENDKSYTITNELIKISKQLFKEDHVDIIKSLENNNIQALVIERDKLLKQQKHTAIEIKKHANDFCNVLSKNNLLITNFSNGDKGVAGQIDKINKNKIDESTFDFTNKVFVRNAVFEDKWYAKNVDNNIKNTIDACNTELKEHTTLLFNFIDKQKLSYLTIQAVLKNYYSYLLLIEISNRVKVYKEENNIGLLSEFNKYIANVVAKEPAPFIYERLGEKYKHFLIDEFQDTSKLQFLNILPLLDNSLAESNYNLIVGDAKQAIYRFRSGDASLITQLPNLPFEKDNDLLNEYGKTLNRNFNEQKLENNFRSKKEIIQFNNFFFSKAKDYLHSTAQNYFTGNEQNYLDDNTGGMVQALEIEAKNNEVALILAKDYTLNCILECINDNFLYSDICILVNKNKQAASIAEFLKENNIPVTSAEALWISKDVCVQFVIEFLTLIKNDKNLILIQSVLNFLDNNFFNYLFKSDDEKNTFVKNLNTLIQQKVSFSVLLKEANIHIDLQLIGALPIYDATQHIISFFELNKLSPNYMLALNNMLWEKTISEDYNWIDFLTYYNQDGKSYAVKSANNLNAVNIYTIHKSKGLEFPIVIVPIINDAEIRLSNLVTIPTNNFLSNENAYIDFSKKLNNTLFEDAFIKERVDKQADDINLLYVAFTRAINRLFFTYKKINSTKESKEEESLPVNSITHIIYNTINSDSSNISILNNNTIYSFGQPCINDNIIKENTSTKINYTSTNNYWYQTLRIGKKYSITGVTSASSQIQFGLIVHDILAKINSIKDLSILVNDFQNLGEIDKEVAVKISYLINKLWQSEHIDDWKDEKNICLSEQDILTATNKIIRPDKVIITPTKVVVYDFKTGNAGDNQKEKYNMQVTEYMQILQQMYAYKKIAGKIIYLQNDNIEVSYLSL